jgi:hypothetical protein
METIVIRHIIELKNFTTPISIKPSSVLLISMDRKNASMENSAHLRTMSRSFQLSLLKSLNQTWTSIFSISKLYGVLIEKMIMREMSVSMPTIGRTIEESLLSLTIQKICAKIGKPKISLLPTRMAVLKNTSVPSAMVGKNKNFILTISKSNNASMAITVRSHIAHIFIRKPIEDMDCHNGSRSFQKPGQFHFRLIFMSQC